MLPMTDPWTEHHIERVDPLDFVKRKPEYFFRGEPNPQEVLEYLVHDARSLGVECTTYSEADWWLVFSATDWLATVEVSPADLFSRAVPAPEQGVNTMRHEILVGAFAEDISIFDGEWHQLTGTREPPASIRSRVGGPVRRAIAFYWRSGKP
jgi:hypothetical protein